MVKFGYVSFFSVCLGASFGAAAGSGDWNTALGGNSSRNGFVEAVGPTAPDLLWQGSRNAMLGEQAVIHRDTVVLARVHSIADGLHGSLIVAHDIRDGRILWEVELPVTTVVTDWRSRVMGAHNGLVYATRAGDTNAGSIYALRIEDGSIAWRSSDVIDESSTESPAITSDGDLIVGNFASLTRISGTNGSTLWAVPRTSPSTDGSSAAVFGDRAYIWEADAAGPRVSAFDANTGARLYSSANIGAGVFQQVGLLVGRDGTVYAPRTQNNTQTDAFVALTDTGSGFTEKWRVPLGYVPFASFGIGPDGSVYTYSPGREILRLDPEDGAVRSRSTPIQSDLHQPRITIGADGSLYMTNGGRASGRLYSFNADLTERWQAEVPNVQLGGPALGQNGVLIVSGAGGDVFAFQSKASPCAPDWNHDGVLSGLDLFDFLNAFFAGDADFNADGETNSRDFFEFMTPFVSGC